MRSTRSALIRPLAPGHLTYGECFLPGESADEDAHSAATPATLHLCNDNLSGIAVAAGLARHLESVERRYSYRFLFAPGTIGAITWLALNEARLENIKHGFVLAGVGDKGGMTYKKSRRGDAEIDRAFRHVLTHCGGTSTRSSISFRMGTMSDSTVIPGFNLPMGSVMRTQWGQYPSITPPLTIWSLSNQMIFGIHLTSVLLFWSCWKRTGPI